MSKLIAISDGHELTTAGKRTPYVPELGRVIHENEFNKAVALLLEVELKRCGFDVLNVSSTDNDSLSERVNRANKAKADLFVAIHYNAFDGSFEGKDPSGHSIHIYPNSKEGRRIAECVLKYMKQGTPQLNRGIVENKFYVLKHTKMPAILTENGFMDNKREALLMLDKAFQQEVAIEHAKGICDYFDYLYIGTSLEPISAVEDIQMNIYPQEPIKPSETHPHDTEVVIQRIEELEKRIDANTDSIEIIIRMLEKQKH